MLRVTRVMAELGIDRVKVTGGEPLARRGVVPFIASLVKMPGIKTVSLTTNAFFLDEPMLKELLDAGISAVTISIDSLDEGRFARITGSSKFNTVRGSLERVFSSKLPVKINTVPIAACNEEDIPEIANLARDHKADVRFIELMPTGGGAALRGIPNTEILSRLRKEFGTFTACDNHGAGPARYYTVRNFKGRIGFISPLSHIFCSSCNRLRLSASGLLRPCLAHETSVNLKALLRGGARDEEIEGVILGAVYAKPRSHNFLRSAERDSEPEQNTAGGLYKIGG